MSQHQYEIDDNSEPEDLADYMKQKRGGLEGKGVGEELLRGGLRVGEQMSQQYLESRAGMGGGRDVTGMGREDTKGFENRDNGSKGRRGDETQRTGPEPGHESAAVRDGRGSEQVDHRRGGTQGGRLSDPNAESSGNRSQEHGGYGHTRGDDRQQQRGSDDIRRVQEGLDGPHSTQDYDRSREQHDQHGSQGLDRKGDRREKGEQSFGIPGSRGPKIGNTGKRTSSKDEESESEEGSSDEESDGSSEGSSDDDSGSEEDSEDESSEEESDEDSGSEEEKSGEDGDEESEEDSDDEED